MGNGICTSALIMYGSACWGGNVSKFERGKLEKNCKKKNQPNNNKKQQNNNNNNKNEKQKAGHVVGKPLDNIKTL